MKRTASRRGPVPPHPSALAGPTPAVVACQDSNPVADPPSDPDLRPARVLVPELECDGSTMPLIECQTLIADPQALIALWTAQL